MNKIAPVSFCLIARNEAPRIEACLKSIRPYVDEIVLVDTGSTDNTMELAKPYVDKLERFTDCNDPETGFIADFSMARNYAFSLAKHDWCGWADLDDLVVGAEKLHDIISSYQNNPQFKDKTIQIMFPYEYAHDPTGNVTCLHYRERLIYPKTNFKWCGRVHEVLVPTVDSAIQFKSDEITIIHKRNETGKTTDPLRNFRILKKWVDEIGDSDPRQLYYLGLEYGNIGDRENALKVLKRYVNLTGWDDEKCLALLDIAKHHLNMGEIDTSLEFASKAVLVKEKWGEIYLHIGKCYYYLALKSEQNNEALTISQKLYDKCINFIKIGLGMPPTETVLWINPLERSFDIHKYLNFAMAKVGDINGAIDSVDKALKIFPEDESLLNNRKVYINELSRKKAIMEIDTLFNSGNLTEEQRNNINGILSGLNFSGKSIKEVKMVKENIWKEYHRPEGYPKNVKDSDFPEAIKTPNSQAWGIPEDFVYEDLPVKMSDKQLQSLVGILYKELMWHDEVLSAISLLENAPYRVKHSALTEDMLRRTKKCINWISNEEEYNVGNAAIDQNGELLNTDMTPLNYPLTGQAAHRYQWMTDRMPDKSKSILDMACIDGQMTNRWGMNGWSNVVGVDCCTNSIKIAKGKAEEYKTGAKHVLSYFDKAPEVIDEKFDNITCGDVYEHLIDPVKDLLIPARKMVKNTGKFLMTTPHGAWFRGIFSSKAHPWLWGNEGEHWLSSKNRGHIIAPSVWSVADHFKKSGWKIKDCVVNMQCYQDVLNQGNVCVEAYPEIEKFNGKDIVMYLGNGLEEWTPHTVDLTGIGGSEIAAINMCKEFVKLGHKVRIYTSCGVNGEGIYDSVEYYMSEKYHDLDCDVLIVSRNAGGLNPDHKINAKVRYLWVHDTIPYNLTHEISLWADKILALSNWHKEHILSNFNYLDESQIVVTQNGLDLTRFDKEVKRNPHKVVYSSSPDRGLPVLLKCWNKIKQEVEDAELHVYYGFDNWKKVAANDPAQTQFINQTMSNLENMKSLGVHYHNRVNQNRLAEEFLSAGVWAFSTWYLETSCISSMEMQAAGVAMVTSNLAALKETTGERGVLIDGDWLSAEYQEKFIKEVVNALKNTTEEKRQSLQQYAREHFDWKKVAKSWNEMFNESCDKINITPYKGIN